VFCVVLCVDFYGPFCNDALKRDISTLFTTFFLCKSLQFNIFLAMTSPSTRFMKNSSASHSRLYMNLLTGSVLERNTSYSVDILYKVVFLHFKRSVVCILIKKSN